ncbi:pyridoxal phosphate-dependent aminotransferase [Miniphocaeibacter massiliensis]|uniref:pyridoxal phosphate-dependent aminotransferase n=1 Tax=Miniphocaeibacter massiliensis TaxID=2041841 RepID=UPI000C0753D4|nr:pyridoxal phosphate-dependent aminotransferase [Miniphocaeibacter massiliensis]
MLISNRIKDLRVSPIRKLIPYTEQCENKGINVIKLNIGQPDIETPKEFFDAINNFKDKTIAYSHSRGSKEFIESTIKYYKKLGIEYEYKEIIATQGASEALMFVMMAVCNANESIITPEPFYANYRTFSDMVSVDILPITTYAKEGFKLPKYEDFKKFVKPHTKAILLSNPNNPTGRVYSEEELQTVIKIAEEFDLFIISDEVYREFNYGKTPFVSFAKYKEVEDRLILIDSISKRYSCCGARIGNIASKNKILIEALMKLSQSRLSAATLELAGASGLIDVPESYLKTTLEKYRERKDVLFNRLKSIEGVHCNEPEGAFYAIVKLPVDDAEKFVIWMLENISVNGNTLLVTPIKDFYVSEDLGKDEVRVSYCVGPDEINKAMDVLEIALREYNNKDSN